jgi:hypothetical protein
VKRVRLALALLLALPALTWADEPPPAVRAMWEGKDGASVRAALLGYAALGERPDAGARQKLDAGEAAWWLGVQDERAGRADSALANWRRAVRMRGDFDEGFALIDALFRRGRPDELGEAYVLASQLAGYTHDGSPERAPEAQARLAWAYHLRGAADSALAAAQPWSDALRGQPAWTRRLATIELAGRDRGAAWQSLTLLSARTRQQDTSVESLLIKTQHALGYSDGRRQVTVLDLRADLETGERRFTRPLRAHADSLPARDGFRVRWFLVPAASRPATGPAPAPMLFVLSPDDSLVAADSLAAALAASGRTVAYLAPRGSYGAFGRGVYGPEAWAGRPAELDRVVAADAALVMDALERRSAVPRGGWVVGAAGSCAPTALTIARARHDVQSLVLVAPKLPLVEVAEYRARLNALRTPMFVQVAP